MNVSRLFLLIKYDFVFALFCIYLPITLNSFVKLV